VVRESRSFFNQKERKRLQKRLYPVLKMGTVVTTDFKGGDASSWEEGKGVQKGLVTRK